jgi:hypothetical protein
MKINQVDHSLMARNKIIAKKQGGSTCTKQYLK